MMKHVVLSFAMAAVSFHLAQCQVYRLHSSIPGLGAGALSKNFRDAFAAKANPAAVPTDIKISAGASVERSLFIEDIKKISLSATTVIMNGGAAVCIDHFTSAGLTETTFELNYSRSLGKVTVGVGASYLQVAIPVYGKDAAPGISAGALFEISQKAVLAVKIDNPVGSRFLKSRDLVQPFKFVISGAYIASENVAIESYLTKVQSTGMDAQVFVLYQFRKSFLIKCGTQIRSGMLVASAGWQKKGIRVLVSVSYSNRLSVSPSMMMTYASENIP